MPKAANPRCPAHGENRCTGELCGHCSRCRDALDNHDHLALTPDQRGFTQCPRDRKATK